MKFKNIECSIVWGKKVIYISSLTLLEKGRQRVRMSTMKPLASHQHNTTHKEEKQNNVGVYIFVGLLDCILHSLLYVYEYFLFRTLRRGTCAFFCVSFFLFYLSLQQRMHRLLF